MLNDRFKITYRWMDKLIDITKLKLVKEHRSPQAGCYNHSFSTNTHLDTL